MCADVTDELVEKFIDECIPRDKWEKTGDMMKIRYRNMTRNFLSVVENRSFMPVPDFMIKPVRKPKKEEPPSANKPKSVKSQKKLRTAPVRRNPKRKVSEVNYFEADEPNEDRYVFCDTCQTEYLDFCSRCGMLKSLKDFPVPVGTQDRARQTVPRGILEIRPSKIHGLGVFATRNIGKGIQMGPYEGRVTRINTTNGYSWKLRDGRLIDAADETCSNWLRFVNCARHMTEQNVVAFQYKGQLYYRTCRKILTGEELLVYYGSGFASLLGINTKKYFHPEAEEVNGDYFSCQFCKIGLSTENYRDMHEKHCRFKPSRICTGEESFVCKYCNCTVTTEKFLRKHEIKCIKYPKRKSNVGGKEHQCPICEKKFTSKWYLTVHISAIHDKEKAKVFSCNECQYKTFRLSALTLHLRTHQQVATYKCEKCQKGFSTKQNFDGHILKSHQDLLHLITVKVYQCQECNYRTVYSHHLKYHMNVTHGKNSLPKFACTKCEYSSVQKSNLKKHSLTHSNKKKPHVCVECKKDFIQKPQLDSHILNNHEENDDLMRSITNQIHFCQLCAYKSIYKHNVSRHMNTHKK